MATKPPTRYWFQFFLCCVVAEFCHSPLQGSFGWGCWSGNNNSPKDHACGKRTIMRRKLEKHVDPHYSPWDHHTLPLSSRLPRKINCSSHFSHSMVANGCNLLVSTDTLHSESQHPFTIFLAFRPTCKTSSTWMARPRIMTEHFCEHELQTHVSKSVLGRTLRAPCLRNSQNLFSKAGKKPGA